MIISIWKDPMNVPSRILLIQVGCDSTTMVDVIPFDRLRKNQKEFTTE